MRFLVDAQPPPSLARWLASCGHPTEHVAERDLAAAKDRAVWDYAMATNAAIITKDEDFALRRALVSRGPPIVWIRVGNTRKQALLVWFDARLPEIVQALSRGETLIEVV
jgi:predicted nuclease of predicted toxin-antitoxin system